MFDFENAYPYHISYIDFTLGEEPVPMIDCFNLDGFRHMVDYATNGEIIIKSVDISNPLDPSEYTTIYSNDEA